MMYAWGNTILVNCSGQNQSGVKIKAWGNVCTTGSDGTCIVSTNVPCQDSVGGGDQLSTSVVAGKDADSAQPHYYTRVNSPSFTRESCATIGCNYTGSPLTSSPAREAYYISAPTDDTTAQENLFIRKACSIGDGDANAGYDFKQISGCAAVCPTVATPGGLTATYNGGASSTFSWNAVSNSSTPVTYGLQIDNSGSVWTSDTCAGTVQGGDTCNLNYTGTSFSRPTNLGNSFRWRVKANNACGNTSNWTAWTNYTVPTPPNCTSFGGLTSIAGNTISTHQVLASGDPIQGQLAWRCGAGGTWGDWQVADYLTKASPYTFDFNSNVTCGSPNQDQTIQLAVNLYRGICTNEGCRDLSPQKLALRQSLWFHA